MKKFLKTAIALASLLISTATMAQTTGLVGFANYSDRGLQGTTGGRGGQIVHVTTREDFAHYAGASEPYIIILDANLHGHYNYSTNPKQKHDVITVKSNKTIIGGGSGARLDSLGLDVNGSSNIIIRNLTISKADPDAIAFRESHHIWVDHCDLSSQKAENDANDGLLDFTNGSSYLTVSWTRFHDHDKSSICSSGTRNIKDIGNQRVTYHHNSFINCTQRNPRIGYGLGHIFNDYNENNSLYAIGLFARAIVNVENCFFKNCKEAFNQMYSADYGPEDCYWGFVYSSGNHFESSKGTDGNIDAGFDVGYYYDYDFALNDASELPGLLGQMGPVAGLESDIIPFPGDGAIGLPAGTQIFCGDIEGAEGYLFRIGTSPDALTECDPAALQLAAGTTYYWDVTVKGGQYDGKKSGVFRFTTSFDEPLNPVPFDGDMHTALREITSSVPSHLPDPITFHWAPTFDAAGYTVYLGTNESLTDAEGVIVETPAYQPPVLTHGQQYFWRVDAKKKDGTVTTGKVWTFKSDVAYAKVGRNEAEHAVRGGLCFPERDVTEGWIVASNDSCCVGDEGQGYMSFVWNGRAGSYNLKTAYFDEKSGHGTYFIFVNETQKDRWFANKDKNTMEVHETKDVELAPGDELRIAFYTGGTMRCRTDYIDVEDPTGIMEVVRDENTPGEDVIYNLQGIKVKTPSVPGIYIVNGKKTYIR